MRGTVNTFYRGSNPLNAYKYIFVFFNKGNIPPLALAINKGGPPFYLSVVIRPNNE